MTPWVATPYSKLRGWSEGEDIDSLTSAATTAGLPAWIVLTLVVGAVSGRVNVERSSETYRGVDHGRNRGGRQETSPWNIPEVKSG